MSSNNNNEQYIAYYDVKSMNSLCVSLTMQFSTVIFSSSCMQKFQRQSYYYSQVI